MDEPILSALPETTDVPVFEIFFSAWRALLIAAFLGAIAGGAFFLLTPSQWGVDVRLQIGQVGGTAVELPQVAAERVRRDNFLEQVRRAVGWSGADAREHAGLLEESFRVTVLEKADLVDVAVRVYDPSDAEKVVSAIADELRRSQEALAAMKIEQLKAELVEADRRLERLESDLVRIIDLVTSPVESKPGLNFSEQVLVSSLYARTLEQADAQRSHRRALHNKLSNVGTFPTRTFAGFDVSRKPVFPRGGGSVAIGAFLGLLLGAGFVLVRHSRVRLR